MPEDAVSTLSPWMEAGIASLLWLAAWTVIVKALPGRWKERWFVGFGVDAVIAIFTLGPIALALALPRTREGGWVAWLASPVVASCVFLALWCVGDELIRGERGGFRIWRYWLRRDGLLRYLLGWSILLAVPVFWMIRVAEVVVYPALNAAWGLPRLRTRDFIALSRHKTRGLVGADYLFCLYCEWMTGLWSMGTEMLRHLESMWCPLRFGRAEQCDRCSATFPDIPEWTDPEEGMPAIQRFYELHYEGRPLGERSHLGAREEAAPAAGEASS